MAKFNSSAVGGDIRGKIGSSVFSRNKGGAYIRTKVTPVNPKTPAQQAVRQNFGQNSKAWSGTLTDLQRSGWNAFAASNPVRDVFGNSIILTGLATFNRCNQVLLQIGQPVILDPPVDYSVITAPIPTSADGTAGGGVLEFSIPAGPATPTTDYYVFATPNLAVGKTPNQNLYRFIGAYEHFGTVSTVVDVSVNYLAKFGALIEGKNVFLNVGQVNTETGALLTGTILKATIAV